MKRFKGTRGLICLAIAILLIVGYYYYLSNRETKIPKEETVEISPVQNLLLEDLENHYPPTPKEVVKYYCEVTKCLHNDELTEEQVEALAQKIQEIYDDELIQNKPQNEYLADLKSEISMFKENKYSISNYAVSASTDVEYYDKNNYSFAKLDAIYYIRVNTNIQTLNDVFLLRKDEKGHWKIFGWKPVTEQETDGNE